MSNGIEEYEGKFGYGDFAQAYDALTFNVPYDEIAEYYNEILCSLTKGKRLLDMGCGTGSLSIRLAERGFEVIGQDASSEMLTIAAAKSSKVRWICQNMSETELGEPADAVISTLDSINHLQSAEEMEKCFAAAARSLKTGGVFAFDVNTIFKHREILGANTFVYDVDGVYCVWQNEFDPSDNSVGIELDLFFEEDDGAYTRGYESFREVAVSETELRTLLEKTGFQIVEILEYLTHSIPDENTEKLMIVAKKS